MKIWYGYGSEHSMNLVMIGQFRDAGEAAKAKQIIEWISAQVNADVEQNLIKIGERIDRYSDTMLELLGKIKINTIGPAELEQFAYDVTTEVKGNQLVVTTDEIDVSAFLKVMLEEGARVEVFSAHDYPRTNSEISG